MKKIFKILTATAIITVFSFEFSTLHAQDAEYELLRHQYTIREDGTMDINYRKEIKLLRNRAITAYADKGETFILYNPATDRLTINESYTVRKDGSRVTTPPNAFIDQLPSQCADCGRYNGLRERVVVHTGLEYDCTVVLDYTLHRRADCLEETFILAEDCPIKQYELIVDAPKGALTSQVEERGQAKQVNDGHSLHVVAKNLPQKEIANYLPNERELYPYVRIAYGHDHYKMIEMPIEALPEADYVLGELFDNDPLTYATNIRDYVTDHVHTTDFPLSLINYNVSPAKETFLSMCGTPRDKEWLTVTMLRQAGFSTENGEGNGRIKVGIKEQDKTMEYVLVANSKRPARLAGAAVDEQRTIDISRELLWQGTPLGDGYKQMVLPTEEGSINIDPAWLTTERKSPLKVRNCNEKYHYTIATPRTPKHELVKPVNISYTKKGVGSIRISIQQLPGGGVEVVRELNIDVADGIVSPKQYKAFRQLMQDWNTYKTVTVKAQLKRINEN